MAVRIEQSALERIRSLTNPHIVARECLEYYRNSKTRQVDAVNLMISLVNENPSLREAVLNTVTAEEIVAELVSHEARNIREDVKRTATYVGVESTPRFSVWDYPIPYLGVSIMLATREELLLAIDENRGRARAYSLNAKLCSTLVTRLKPKEQVKDKWSEEEVKTLVKAQGQA